MKTTLILMLVGAIIVAVIPSFVVPPALSVYDAGRSSRGAQVRRWCRFPR
jgi:hypothetical protein